VAGDMMVTTLLVTVVAYTLWRWPVVLVFPVAALFFLLDVTFVSANVHKIPVGGWVPLHRRVHCADTYARLAERAARCF
jgi:KUP system potassium uptake protein